MSFLTQQYKLRKSIENNDYQSFKKILLLNHSDIDLLDWELSTMLAVKLGRLNMVTDLFNTPYVEPSSNNAYLIHFSYEHNHFEITKLLFEDKKVYNYLKNKEPSFFCSN